MPAASQRWLRREAALLLTRSNSNLKNIFQVAF